MAKVLRVDKYAKDERAWKLNAEINYYAALALFRHENALMFCFPAAVLGHHAIEAYLKSALISDGMTVFDPAKIRQLDASQMLAKGNCIWGHGLAILGEKLAERQPAFDLNMVILDYWLPYDAAITVRRGLEIFDPFFSELRYPIELDKCDGIGPEDGTILVQLAKAIAPFTLNLSPTHPIGQV